MLHQNQLIDILFFSHWILKIIFIFNALWISFNLIGALVAKKADPRVDSSEKIEKHPVQSAPPGPGNSNEDPKKNKTWWRRHWGKVVGGFVLVCIVANIWFGGPKNL